MSPELDEVLKRAADTIQEVFQSQRDALAEAVAHIAENDRRRPTLVLIVPISINATDVQSKEPNDAL